MTGEYDYISLAQAAKNCYYSQEYLALRARQGKLKAVKFGRNWMTRINWLKEYISNTKEYGLKKVKAQEDDVIVVSDKTAPPPDNLPVEESKRLRMALGLVSLLTGIFLFSSVALVSIDLMKNVPLLKITNRIHENVATVSEAVVSLRQNDLSGVGPLLKEYGQWLAGNYSAASIFIEEKMDNLFQR